ncbi:hypothetical protein TgHK011_008108 [Trichoderma gracile]|nr:hypothetical protein TgHK011_008108 [Trichoderma gracile]
MSLSRSAISRIGLVRRSTALSLATCCRRCLASLTRSTTTTPQEEQWPQRTPLGSYYETIHDHPTAYTPPKPPKKTPSSSSADDKKKPEDKSTAKTFSTQKPPSTSPESRARVIFGSRLLGPAEEADRLALKKAKSTYVAGVLIPPRPEEPDNCCMSGCVNCVWDRYREDMEEWTAKKAEANARLRARSGTMDADGGGSETAWTANISKDLWDEEALKKVPVGIREFMKQEKRLKERHQREGTLGG